MAKISRRTCSCLIILTFGHSPLIIWMRARRNITATLAGGLNIFANRRSQKIFRPQAIRRRCVSFCFREGHAGDAQLLAKFSPISQLSPIFLAISRLMVNFNKSLLIFFLNFIFLHFPFKKSQTHTSISIGRSEAFAVT